MATAELRSSLEKFVTFTRSLKGDEKGEAQLFLDHFFRALGHEGVQEAGATLEFRIAKRPGSAQLELIKGEPAAKAKGGKKFADLLWPERVLIEMKSRGQNLEKHYDQAFEYWTHIVPHRPPFVILCNFDEFWIYDFNTQLFDPVDRILLRDLPQNAAALNFLLPHPEKPRFGNNRVEVTRKAADIFANVFRKIVARGEDRTRAQRFILQLLVSVVSEDIGLLPDNFVTGLLEQCVGQPADSFDLLGGLFRQMATEEEARGGRYAGISYFNGGLFKVVEPIELKLTEADMLFKAADRNDWSQVKPEIFGTLFQHSMEDGEKPGTRDERHAFGAHFTSEADIMKVVGPTISRPWRERIAASGKSLPKLRDTLRDLRLFRVLDPACGSGNFLFVAYREIKRLERTLLLALRDAGERPERLATGISLTNFFGLDVVPFAVELAKVTLMLAKELELREAAKFEAADGLHLPERPLPLDNLDQQILCADSLFTEWPKVDAIIGNAPFLGAKLMKPERGADYVKKVRAVFPAVPGMADYCVYWFRKTHDALPECTEANPTSGRAGLVGTQNIRNNQSRVGGLDHIVVTGTIIEATDNVPWSGEANVNVAIVNWVKSQDPTLLPKLRRVWSKVEFKRDPKKAKDKEPKWGVDYLDCNFINSALSDSVAVSEASALMANTNPQRCFTGQMIGHEHFLIAPDQADQWIRASAANSAVLFPHLIGDELLSGNGLPERVVIDFGQRDVFAAGAHKEPFGWVRDSVLPDRERKAAEGVGSDGKLRPHHKQFLSRWWQLSFPRPELISQIEKLTRYIVCSRVTKRPIFAFVSSRIRPGDALSCFTFDDDYSFGILQSSLHWEWFKAKCAKLTERLRYSPESIFDTFPWPQTPTKKQIAEVAAAAVALRALRREIMAKLGYSLRELYRKSEGPGANSLRDAHTRLDTAVRSAYAMPATADPLAFLLDLNLALAAREKAWAVRNDTPSGGRVIPDRPITPPGLPLPEAERTAFITDDCVHVA